MWKTCWLLHSSWEVRYTFESVSSSMRVKLEVLRAYLVGILVTDQVQLFDFVASSLDSQRGSAMSAPGVRRLTQIMYEGCRKSTCIPR